MQSFTTFAVGVGTSVGAMLGLRVAWMQSRSRARWQLSRLCQRRWEGVKLIPNTYTPNTELETCIFHHLRAFTGVHVLCSPGQTGKTTAAARAIQQARSASSVDQHYPVTGQLHIDCTAFDTLSEALQDTFGKFKPEDVVPNGTILVLDHLDEVIQFDREGMAKLRRRVLHLAQRGVETKRYNTLALVRSPSFARQILSWNGGRKVGAVRSHRMKQSTIQELVGKLAAAHNLPTTFSGLLEEVSPMSGGPGFVVESSASWEFIDEQQLRANAKLRAEEWRQSLTGGEAGSEATLEGAGDDSEGKGIDALEAEAELDESSSGARPATGGGDDDMTRR